MDPESLAVVAVAPPPGPSAEVAELTAQLRNRIARLAPGTLDARETAARMTGPAPGAVLPDLSRAAESARRAYLAREYDRSLALLRGIAADLEKLPDDPSVFDLWTTVMLRLARTELDLGHVPEARASIERLLCAAPDLAVSPSLYPARLVREVEDARAALMAAPKGTLVIESSAAGARVLLNGRDVGVAPVRLTLPHGQYRISGTNGAARTKPIAAEVREEEREIQLDFAIDETLRPELGPGLALPAEHRPGDVVAIGRYLGLDQVVAVGAAEDGGASYVIAELYFVRSGAIERKARVRLANHTMPDGAAAALAEFLVTGRVTSPLVEVPGGTPVGSPERRRVRIFAELGVIEPVAPLTFYRVWGEGRSVGIGAEYGVTRIASLWGRFEYAEIPMRPEKASERYPMLPVPPVVTGGTLRMQGLHIGLRARWPSGRLQPYAELGVGLQIIRSEEIHVSWVDPRNGPLSARIENSVRTTSAFAFSPGAGLLYSITPWLAMFAEGRLDRLYRGPRCYPSDELCAVDGNQTMYGAFRLGLMFR